MGRDSNPRYLAVHTLSRRAQSTALAPIRNEVQTFLRPESSFNLFSKPNFNPERSFGNPVRTERLRRIEGLGERIKFGLELTLPFLNDFQLQLVAMQLNRCVMNVSLNFG
jgi:hypothetical protein